MIKFSLRIVKLILILFLFAACPVEAAPGDEPDPPDCNDPSDDGPLEPGDCGYTPPHYIYLPIAPYTIPPHAGGEANDN